VVRRNTIIKTKGMAVNKMRAEVPKIPSNCMDFR
jgi:hypothetical protein